MKVGVIGAGYWGRKHVDEYSRLKGAELAWVADPSKEAREFCKSTYHVAHTTADYKELLKSDVEAVSICVDNKLHHQVAADALRAGKHVLVEKPLTLDSKTSAQLLALADEQDLTLAVGHIYRFNNAITKLRELAQDRYFGSIFSIISRWTTLEKQSPPRDVVFDLAPHAFDILNFTLNEWPTRITATGRAFRRPSMEEMAFITAEFPSGVLAQIEVSWLLPGKVRTVEVMGSERAARIDCLSQKFMVDESGASFDLGVQRNNTLATELDHFLDAIRAGDHTLNSGKVGLGTVRCLEASVESLRTHKSIELTWP
jgi:UDP-N-acetylglucosamine 3-dehydrogenase